MKKIVFWRSKLTGKTGHGMPIKEEFAKYGVENGNKEYPETYHQMVDADITK